MNKIRNTDADRQIKLNIIEFLELLSSAEKQIDYQKKVPHVYIPSEIICQWLDDFNSRSLKYYKSDIYSEVELNAILKFNNVWEEQANKINVKLSIEEIINTEPWVKMMFAAKQALKIIRKTAQQVDAPEPATMISPTLQTPHRPAR